MIRYGPTNFGVSFLARPLGMLRFFVDRYTKSPLTKGVSLRCRFDKRVCFTRAPIIESSAVQQHPSSSAQRYVHLGTLQWSPRPLIEASAHNLIRMVRILWLQSSQSSLRTQLQAIY